MDLTWDQVDGIRQRAVRRGLARREPTGVRRIGIDETSFQERREYVTVVTDQERSRVLYVADDRKVSSLQPFFDALEPPELAGIEAVSMDMWKPFITVVRANLWDADRKICFDKVHVAKHRGDAVNRVRGWEHRSPMADGDRTLVGTKDTWLQNPRNIAGKTAASLRLLRTLVLETARAWAIKEEAMSLWSYASRTWARKAWERWIGWATRSRLEPIKRVGRMVREHLDGVLNAIVLQATNAGAESINARIQRIERMACGFRNRERFRNAICFHLGGLDLSPKTHARS